MKVLPIKPFRTVNYCVLTLAVDRLPSLVYILLHVTNAGSITTQRGDARHRLAAHAVESRSDRVRVETATTDRQLAKTKAVTVYDIAHHTGTSAATVSRVLNGSVLVGDDLRRRILAVAEELGYIRKPIRRPVSRSVFNVVVIVRGVEDGFDHLFYDLTELIQGLEEGLGRLHANVILATNAGTKAPAFWSKKLGDIDAIVTAFVDPDPELPPFASRRGIPLVLINRELEEVSSVISDDAYGADVILNHLATSREIHSVLFVGAQSAAVVSARRAEAFGSVSGSMGITMHQATVTDPAREASRVLSLAVDRAVDGIVCVNDVVAARLIEAAGRSTRAAPMVRIPQDVAVTGFDGAPFLSLIRPRPTSFVLSAREFGRQAGGLLTEVLGMREPGVREPRRIRIQGTLSVGETSAMELP